MQRETLLGIVVLAVLCMLAFLRDIATASVDTQTVRITTADAETLAEEILPPRYHRKTELTARVDPGRNILHFPLQSKEAASWAARDGRPNSISARLHPVRLRSVTAAPSPPR